MTILLFSASIFLTLILVYPLLSWIVSLFFPRTKNQLNTRQHHYACVIPVYNNLTLARNCIQSLLSQSYSNFRIYVVVDGDNVVPETSFSDKVIYLYPEKKLGSKHRSLHYVLNFLIEKPDYVIIFDADNLAEPHYLQTINQYATPENTAIQGRRIAKNLDTVYACLDAANEYYYNVFFRRVPGKLRSSALTSGSGVAIAFETFVRFFDFKPVREQLNGVIHGEDKYLQAFIVMCGGRIKYTTACTVYDEKVARGREVSSQRARWFISYFKCLPFNIQLVWDGIRHLNWRKLVFGLHASYPPLFILLGCSLLWAAGMLFVLPTASLLVLSGVACLLLSFPVFLMAGNAPRKVLLSLLAAPRFIFFQIAAFFKISKAYNKTLVTQNNRNVSLEEVRMYQKIIADQSMVSKKPERIHR
ncbi:MAG TPA: glycosyltransferase [Ohtaekwangia sp.]|nr:glycosyltransferase [Ohtaekwangia sp.]